MAGEKTTKEILQEKLAKKERTPLYNSEVLKKMKGDFENIRTTGATVTLLTEVLSERNIEITPEYALPP